jgi:Fe(3+) dicitrate transport protein
MILRARFPQAIFVLAAFAFAHALATASVRAQDAGVPPAEEEEELFPEEEDEDIQSLLVDEEDLMIPDVVVMAPAEREEREEEGGGHASLDEEQLERFDYDDPNSVFQQLGVHVRQEDGYGLRPNIGLRGVNTDRSTRVTLMEDGVMFAPAPYAAPAAYYFPLMQRMAGIDVFTGAATIPYGPRTVGGAIDMHTREIPREPTGHLELALGSTLYGRAHAFYGASNSWGGFLIEGVYLHSDGFKRVGEPPEPGVEAAPTGFDRGEIVVRGEIRGALSDDVYHRLELRLMLGGEVSHETYLGLTDEDFRRDPYLRYEASINDRMSWWRTQVQLRHRLEWGDAFELRTTAYRHDFDRSWNKVNAIGGNPAVGIQQTRFDLHGVLLYPTGLNRLYIDILRGREDTSGDDDYILIGNNARVFGNTGIQSDATLRFETDVLRHRIRAGVRLHHDEVERVHDEIAYAMIDGALEAASETYYTLDASSDALAFSAYLAWSVSWETLTLTPGIRTELIWTSHDDHQTGEGFEDFRQAALPGVSLQWQVIRELEVFAGVMRGYAPVGPGQARTVSPEESISYELGSRLVSRSSGTNAEITLFISDYSNFLQQCSFSAGCALAEDAQANAGSALIGGFDLRVGQLFRAGSVQIPLRLSYTYTYTELRSAIEDSPNPQYRNGRPGDHLPYVPEHEVSAQAGIELPEFGLNVSASWVAEMWEAVGNGDELIPVTKTDAYFLLDATAFLRITPGLRIFVRGENLTMTQAIVGRRPFGARPNRPLLVQAGISLDF